MVRGAHPFGEAPLAVLRQHGVPLGCYGDRFGALVRNDNHWTLQEQLDGRQQPTAFGQLLEKLGVEFTPARSPQAKGRVERQWETLQDRLVSELRLLGLTTMEQVEAYLPQFIVEHKERFAKPARDADRAWRSAPHAFEDLLDCRYQRKVARDSTVSMPGRWVQLPPRTHGRSWQGCTVEVRECLDGGAIVFHQELVIVRQAAPPGPFTLIQREGSKARGRCPENFAAPHVLTPKEPVPAKLPQAAPRRRPPAAEHPWNRSYEPNRSTPARAGGRT